MIVRYFVIYTNLDGLHRMIIGRNNFVRINEDQHQQWRWTLNIKGIPYCYPRCP